MRRLLFIGVILYLSIAHSLCNDRTFSIKGTCIVNGNGTLYLFLVDKEQFKIPLTGIQELVIEVNLTSQKKTSLSFEFSTVPKGQYGIRCFLDKNNNRILDKGAFGPKEPWGMSWQGDSYKGGFPKFKDIAFTVESHIHNIVINIE